MLVVKGGNPYVPCHRWHRFVELPAGARDRDGRQLLVLRPARIDAAALKPAPLAEAVW